VGHRDDPSSRVKRPKRETASYMHPAHEAGPGLPCFDGVVLNKTQGQIYTFTDFLGNCTATSSAHWTPVSNDLCWQHEVARALWHNDRWLRCILCIYLLSNDGVSSSVDFIYAEQQRTNSSAVPLPEALPWQPAEHLTSFSESRSSALNPEPTDSEATTRVRRTVLPIQFRNGNLVNTSHLLPVGLPSH
jgi:hypothetical protein